MKHLFRLMYVALTSALAVTSCLGQQPAIGTYPFGSFAGSPDVVNLGNLNDNLQIPIRHKTGRGTDFDYNISYNNALWTLASTGSTKSWQPDTRGYWGWNGLQTVEAYGSYTMTYSSGTCGVNGADTYQIWQFSGVVYQDEHGATHTFRNGGTYINSPGGTSCPGPVGATPSGWLCGSNGEGMSACTNVGAGSMQLYFIASNGSVINPPIYVNNTAPSSISYLLTDANGNQISMSNGTYTDTLGQTALSIVGTAPSNTTLSYLNASGSNSMYTVTYVSKNVKTSFGCSGITEYSKTNVSLVDTISLPDGRSYQFTYEGTPGYSGYTTGRVASVTLPTGGTISYSYNGPNDGIECTDASISGMTRTTPDGQYEYTRTQSGSQSTTTVTAPAYSGVSDTMVIKFLQSGANYYEISRQLYSGSSTLLETVLHCYESSDTDCSSSAGDSGTHFGTPFSRVKITQQWPDNTGISSGTLDTYDTTGFNTLHEVHDYAAGGVYGSLLQQTITTYSSSYGNQEVPTEVTVKDGAGTQTSDTQYTYTATTTAIAGTPQHVSGTPTLDNVASVKRWVSGTNYQTQSYTYYDTGNVRTATDVNGASVTTYTYGGCSNSLLTGTSTPVKNPAGIVTTTLTTSAVWDCVGGVQTSSTDYNNNTTNYSYGSDPYWRPVSSTDAGNNTISYSYPKGSSPNTSSVSTTFNVGSSITNVVTTTDGLGRTELVQRQQGPSSSNYDSITTSYDSRGRKACQLEVPYGAVLGSYTSPNSTNAVCTSYDAIDRPSKVTDAGGGTSDYSYPTNTSLLTNNTLITLGPAPAGENAKTRLLAYNGAGQLTSVCEITSLTGYGSCGSGTSKSGYLTQYTYDGANLIKTQQNVQAGSSKTQTRTINAHDGLGRVLSETIPEWSAGNGVAGTTSYVYDTDSTCGSTSTGDLIKKTDNAGNVICNTYDSLHRLLTSEVVSGPYASNTPASNFVYDAASYGSTAMKNAKGSLAEAFTGTSTSKITDLYFSSQYATSGATIGGVVTQVWEGTPHSGSTYYLTTDVAFPNGVLGYQQTTYGVPNVHYGLDGEGRPTTVLDSSHTINLITAGSYNTAGQITGLTYGNGDSDAFTYDPNTNRPATLVSSIAGSNPFTMTTTLTWNANASLKTMQIADTNDASKNQTCNYTADDLSRIASVNCGTSTWAQNFTYDAFGNVNKANAGNATSYSATYSPITNQVSGGPAYDANGNPLSSTGLATIGWNAAGTAVTVTPLSGATISGTFDAFNRLVETSTSTGYTDFVYGGTGAKVGAVSGGTLQSGSLALPGGGAAVYTASGLSFIRHTDWLGSARLGTTWAHAVYSKESYAPFGETYNEAGTADRNFTGHDQSEVTGAQATGTYETWFRKYDPAAGRWLGPDPLSWSAVDLSNPQTLNRYGYAINTPLVFVDPLGLEETNSCDPLTGVDCFGGGEAPWDWEDPGNSEDYPGCAEYVELCYTGWPEHAPDPIAEHSENLSGGGPAAPLQPPNTIRVECLRKGGPKPTPYLFGGGEGFCTYTCVQSAPYQPNSVFVAKADLGDVHEVCPPPRSAATSCPMGLDMWAPQPTPIFGLVFGDPTVVPNSCHY